MKVAEAAKTHSVISAGHKWYSARSLRSFTLFGNQPEIAYCVRPMMAGLVISKAMLREQVLEDLDALDDDI